MSTYKYVFFTNLFTLSATTITITKLTNKKKEDLIKERDLYKRDDSLYELNEKCDSYKNELKNYKEMQRVLLQKYNKLKEQQRNNNTPFFF
jgi:hypothetical protein